jgi:apolipoprotein N-acyltransferase
VEAGGAPRAVAIALPGDREIRFGTPVCYELLFPDLVRRFAADGGRALLAITNDAWYGRTGAPYQFLAITELRAAETRLAIARAANTGVSAFIDGDGSTRGGATPIFEATWRTADLPLHPAPAEATFYVRHGDLFAYACWALLRLRDC